MINGKTTLLMVSTLLILSSPTAALATPLHGVAMHGEPRYEADFTHFDYTNPDAPKGGTVKLAAIGGFDSLNPFILKGRSATGIGLTFDALTVSSDDEAFSRYGLIAETIDMPEDRSSVTFTLRAEARFHDGHPITVEDVIWTFETLKSEGHPFYRSYYGSVTGAEKVGDRQVKFTFAGGENRELPLIISEMVVLPKHFWADREFQKADLNILLGSGPYRIEKVEAGRSITYQRVEDYWARDLAVSQGKYNYDTIRYDYYRDATIALEALKAGEYDFRSENSSKRWATGYQSPALENGLLKQELIPNDNPTGMQGFVFNTRRPLFEDPRVRQALAHAFDFEWTNKTLFYGAYTRTASYFSNSELASKGLPSGEELEILEAYRGRIPDAVFDTAYTPPLTDGSGNARDNLRTALELLKAAGWEVRDKKLTQLKSDEAMKFEMLLVSPAFERIVLPYKKNLERLGIEMSVRTIDGAQYQKRLENYDFDMIVSVIGQSLSPGNEQRNFWGSEVADQPGSRNLAGIKDSAIDELIEQVISAPDREGLVQRTRALDRVLLHGHYVIPQWHMSAFRIAYWDKFARPAKTPKYALGFMDNWWVDPERARSLEERKSAIQ